MWRGKVGGEQRGRLKGIGWGLGQLGIEKSFDREKLGGSEWFRRGGPPFSTSDDQDSCEDF